MLATGVVLGGLGLLLSGLALGSTREEPTSETADPEPVERIEQSLATVVVERGGTRSTASGVVLDGQGHVLVPASALDGAERVEASCGDSEASAVTTVARDPASNLAVLRMDRPAGTPIAVAADQAAAQGRVILARATEEGASTVAAVLSEGERLVAAAAQDSQVVFDRSGRFLGMSAEDGELTPATELLAAARTLMDEGA
jgi:S1-C subfamily serine protease